MSFHWHYLLIPIKPSLILGTIYYKHPSMQHFKFNNNFMKRLISLKISLEKKGSLRVGDVSLNLIKYRQTTGVNQFLEVMSTNNFILQVTLPTWINKKPATVIDNIFLNYHEHHQCIAGNLTTYISDHLPPIYHCWKSPRKYCWQKWWPNWT